MRQMACQLLMAMWTLMHLRWLRAHLLVRMTTHQLRTLLAAQRTAAAMVTAARVRKHGLQLWRHLPRSSRRQLRSCCDCRAALQSATVGVVACAGGGQRVHRRLLTHNWQTLTWRACLKPRPAAVAAVAAAQASGQAGSLTCKASRQI